MFMFTNDFFFYNQLILGLLRFYFMVDSASQLLGQKTAFCLVFITLEVLGTVYNF